MATSKSINVLYVDDEIHNLNSFKATFRKEFNVLTASSVTEGLEVLKNTKDIQIVITDQRMPMTTGVEFLTEVLRKYPDILRVLLTGFTDATAISDALGTGLAHYRMEKPWDEEQIRVVINAAYEISLLRKTGLRAQYIDVAIELDFILRQNLLS
ncbi:hypothetical protein GCM10010967_41380 [Dyadobacter beijingensis]|uniref:Response regulatory domain-containing protein n=1 Tax=Dyadobacter beijingensis TaxID=365489 RepID=A0ABQ2I8D5_9BACT|nr:response regulator [Dyadobacter beijingensis]GGN02467.1 hypothetical protein GCM10010967_41380 [Dyadobacter beijingensis]